MLPRELMARVDGQEYRPGGASEIDELSDLFAIWEEQRVAQQNKGTGMSANMMDDD